VSDIDYSKPVGWWCSTCGITADYMEKWDSQLPLSCNKHGVMVPVFTPLPVPEPCVIDDLGEVVTVMPGDGLWLGRSVFASTNVELSDDESPYVNASAVAGWPDDKDINRIALASARLRGKGE